MIICIFLVLLFCYMFYILLVLFLLRKLKRKFVSGSKLNTKNNNYVVFLEVIVFVLLCVLWSNFIYNHYYCTIDYELRYFDTFIFNFSDNYSYKYYDKEQTLLFIKNNDLNNYDMNLSCKFYLNKNKIRGG
jgi:hypothetical protein